MRKIGVFWVFLFLVISILPVWASNVEDIVSRSSYTEEEKAYLQNRVTAITQEISVQNLPVSFIFSKFKEGVGKLVNPYILVQTLERRKKALLEAKEILDDAGIEGKAREKTLTDLALSIELSVPAPLLREVVQRVKNTSPKDLPKIIASISTLLEVGVDPVKVGSVAEKVVVKNLKSEEVTKIATLLERARRSGVDMEQTAGVLEEALDKYNNFNLVEMEIRQFIASSRQKPSLSSGQGVPSGSPGISGTTPTQEGGTPLESSSSGHPPTQEGGGSLE